MRQVRASWGLLLVAVVGVAACDKGGDAGTPMPAPTGAATAAMTATSMATTTATTEAAAPPEDHADEQAAGNELRHHHRHHHHGGVAMFIHMAIDTLGVSAEKKAQIEKIQSDLHAKMAPSREAGRNVLSLLADGVAAGNVDNAKLNAAIAKQESAAAAVQAASADALNQLHEALSPEERSALVEKVQAHADTWKKVTHEEEYGGKEKEGRLGKLTTELGLSADQVEKISAALKKDAPAKPDAAALDAHIKEFTTAFAAEKFDAKTLTSANAANAHVSKFGTARTVRFYRIVTPLLEPEQRTKLAASLRERLDDKHGMK